MDTVKVKDNYPKEGDSKSVKSEAIKYERNNDLREATQISDQLNKSIRFPAQSEKDSDISQLSDKGTIDKSMSDEKVKIEMKEMPRNDHLADIKIEVEEI